MKRTNNQLIVYQVLYDIGADRPGFLAINRQFITKKRFQQLDNQHKIQHSGQDIVLDFGIAKHTFRFSGITENYLGLTDLASQMIVSSVDTFKKGIELDNGHTYQPDLRSSVDKSECFVPEGMILPAGLSKMFPANKVHYYSTSLPQVGRLGDILYAGTYNLTHQDMFDKD